MRAAGFLLLLAGLAIVLATVVVLKAEAARAAFVLAGVAVEGLGLALVIRSYPVSSGRRS